MRFQSECIHLWGVTSWTQDCLWQSTNNKHHTHCDYYGHHSWMWVERIPAWKHAGNNTFSSCLFPYPLAPSDYQGGTFTVKIPAGGTMANLSVTTSKSALVEDDKIFKATVSIPDGPDNLMVGVDTAFVTIIDRTGNYAVRLRWLLHSAIYIYVPVCNAQLQVHASFLYVYNFLCSNCSSMHL